MQVWNSLYLEQMKLLPLVKMDCHPQTIRFALSLHGKSPSAYIEQRASGARILSRERVLVNYKKYFQPKTGIGKGNVQSLQRSHLSLLYSVM